SEVTKYIVSRSTNPWCRRSRTTRPVYGTCGQSTWLLSETVVVTVWCSSHPWPLNVSVCSLRSSSP
ncbi:MAG: hypothetical protein KDA79_23970, partial [Planctomycetaceae bacterium]|nr:hypothetical protein [Planctomycetaceae bacterium]